MQDKVMGQIPRRSSHRWVFAAPLGTAVVLILVLVFAAFGLGLAAFAPRVALAAPSASQVTVDVVIDAAGTCTVHEKRTMQVSGDDSWVTWSYDAFPEEASVTVEEVALSGDFAGSSLRCESVTLQGDWRARGVPAGSSTGTSSGASTDDSANASAGASPASITACYGIDYKNRDICLFLGGVEGQVTVDLTYQLQSALSLYKDVADLTFPIVSSQWEADAEDVRAIVHLPVPEGLIVAAGEDVYAWGHGPEDGTVVIGADGSVTCYAQEVSAGQGDEVHLCFPCEWLTALPKADQSRIGGSYHLASAISGEEAWADESHHRQIIALALFLTAVFVSLIVLVVAVLLQRKEADRFVLKRNLTVLSAVHFAVLLLFGLVVQNLCIVAIAAAVSLIVLLLAYAQRRPHGC